MQGMRLSVHVDDGMGRQPLVRADGASSAGVVRAGRAYASLRLQGDHVVVRKEKGRPKGRDHLNRIEGFWSYAKDWPYPFRGVPRKHFHLFMGEICFRFNHLGEDFFPLLYNLLRSTGMTEIEPILVRFR
jgi:transposase